MTRLLLILHPAPAWTDLAPAQAINSPAPCAVLLTLRRLGKELE